MKHSWSLFSVVRWLVLTLSRSRVLFACGSLADSSHDFFGSTQSALVSVLLRHLLQFAKHWTGRARWDYYGYDENSDGSYQDVHTPRNFPANLITLSVRYGF